MEIVPQPRMTAPRTELHRFSSSDENPMMKPTQAATRHAPRTERPLFSSSDDNAMMKQIQATHVPDGRGLEFKVKSLLHLVEDIFHRATPSDITGIVHQQAPLQAQMDALEEKTFENGFSEMLELLAFTINKVSCEISYKCANGGEAHATTMAIFHLLSSYAWDAKVVIALAAFAVNYGEFWLVAQLYLTNPLAKGVALLKKLPEILDNANLLKHRLEAISSLVNAMLNVANCIVEFNMLPSQYITPDTPEMLMATAHIPIAVYWTIRSILACASQIIGLIGVGHELMSSTTEAWELSSLAHKVNSIHSHLKTQLTRCYQHIDEKRQIEAYQTLVRIFETAHVDNMKPLRALIYAKDDQPPLLEGRTRRKFSLDVLRRKIVLLLISDLELSHGELSMLVNMYSEARDHPQRAESQYEVVWLPVVDRSTPWNETKQKQFEEFQQIMPWYSVHNPSLIEPAVIKYIKELWHFKKSALLVVMDPVGKVVNLNALHMMWIWGSMAFPFTSSREEQLWKEETWKIELLADSIDPNIPIWVGERKYVCIYGGEDLEWIRQFTTTAQAVARAANIPLEMLYFGKSNPRETIRRNNSIIQAEKLSHVLQDLTLMWFFWVRLESMWHSKVQHNRSVEDDPIMQEIMMMLSFDGSDRGWAVFSAPVSGEMARGKGETMLTCLQEYKTWEPLVPERGFVNAINDHLQALHSPHHCSRLILPGTSGNIPERVVCAECGRLMEKLVMYRCCTE